jgi:DNA-binding IclR family transcriptional regulator
MRTERTGRTIQSSKLTLSIISALSELEGARTTELADHLGVSKSTISNHMYTLWEEEYVTMDGDIYYPSLKFATVGEHARRREPAFETVIKVMEDLDEEIAFQNSFMVEENGLARYFTPEIENPGRYDRYAFVGESEFLHATASGKAILSELPDEHVESILDWRGLPAVTEQTTTDRQKLERELRQTSERGYAINDCENRPGLYVLATPVSKPDGTVLGAISIGSQRTRIKIERFTTRIVDTLSEYATRMEKKLATSTSLTTTE